MRYTVNRYGAIPRKDWGGTLTGASTGYRMGSSIGSMFGPVGAGIGAAAGIIGGAIFGNAGENKRLRQQQEQDLAITKMKNAEKLRMIEFNKRQTRSNDALSLVGLSLNNSSSLFMPQGGVIKASKTSISAAENGAREYRDNVTKFDSLRTILRPHLTKSGKDHLTSDEIKNILGDDGHALYNKISGYLSNAYSANPKLGVDMSEFKGSLENPNSKIASYLYGKKIDSHKFPNPEFPVIDTKTKEVLYNTSAYNPGVVKPAFIRANGGSIGVNGISLKGGNKLLTKNGSINGSHETGQNIPIKKNNEIVAIGEPGEVLVNDKDISSVPFVLSKRLGFAQKFMKLEDIKTPSNNDRIEDEQSKLVAMNNKIVKRGTPLAFNGADLLSNAKMVRGAFNNPNSINTSGISLNLNNKLRPFNGTLPKEKLNLLSKFKGLDKDVIAGAAGTIGNLVMSNKTIKRQKGLIQNSLNDALAYTPTMNKNYLLNENVDVNDQVSGVNQGFASAISGLDEIDPAIASALKNNASVTRSQQLGSIYGNRNRTQIGLRNQNTMNIMNTAASNNSLLNETALMKLNAKISANEQLGEAENARLGNIQGAVGEFNTILRDKQMMDSLRSRWKDTIGNEFEKAKVVAFGGKLKRKRRMSLSY